MRTEAKLRSESETVWHSRQNISKGWKESQVLPQGFILSTALLSLGLESPGLLNDLRHRRGGEVEIPNLAGRLHPKLSRSKDTVRPGAPGNIISTPVPTIQTL